jgi:hypothetical protein
MLSLSLSNPLYPLYQRLHLIAGDIKANRRAEFAETEYLLGLARLRPGQQAQATSRRRRRRTHSFSTLAAEAVRTAHSVGSGLCRIILGSVYRILAGLCGLVRAIVK